MDETTPLMPIDLESAPATSSNNQKENSLSLVEPAKQYASTTNTMATTLKLGEATNRVVSPANVAATASATYTAKGIPLSKTNVTAFVKANVRNSRKALSNFLRKKKEEIEEDYATWQGRVSVHLKVGDIDLAMLTEELKKSNLKAYSSICVREGGLTHDIRTEWEVDDRYYDVVRVWQKPFVVVPSLKLMEQNEGQLGKGSSGFGVPAITRKVLEDELKREIIALEEADDGFLTDDPVDDNSKHQSRTLSSALADAASPEIFIFSFGAVVCWNFPDDESELRWINDYLLINPSICGDRHDEEATESASDEITFEYDENGNFSIRRDKAQLCTREIGEKLAISFAIAKSSLLSIYEWMLEKTIERNSHIPLSLAKNGSIDMSREAIRKEIGRIFIVKHAINLDSDLEDTPDEFWEDDRFEYIYQKMLMYFEITKRLNLVNNRLKIIQDLHQVLIEAVESRHSSALEWIVIILIVIEIVFEVIGFLYYGII